MYLVEEIELMYNDKYRIVLIGSSLMGFLNEDKPKM